MAILATLAATTAIGIIQGLLITKLRLPSFIVTLAGLIGWEGVMIWMFDHLNVAVGGVISVSNNDILDLVSGTLSPVVGWVVMAALVVVFALMTLFRDTRRRATGLVAPPLGLSLMKIVLAAVAGALLVAVCNTNRGIHSSVIHTVVRGVPFVIPIILGILLASGFLLSRTKFGRYVYAIGGNAEAARRAGINLTLVRTACFALAGLLAGIAGVIYTSWLGSIATDIEGGTYVLYAVAAAVIGGTSLFGGRGKPLHALLGGLVIAAIANGLALLGASASATYMVTALVLLIAITVDSVRAAAARPLPPGARRSRAATSAKTNAAPGNLQLIGAFGRPNSCGPSGALLPMAAYSGRLCGLHGGDYLNGQSHPVDERWDSNTSPTRPVAVRLANVRNSFGSVEAIAGVDLEIFEGEFFTMLGPSGSGKTTLLRAIAGFERLDSATVELGGKDVTRDPPYLRDVNVSRTTPFPTHGRAGVSRRPTSRGRAPARIGPGLVIRFDRRVLHPYGHSGVCDLSTSSWNRAPRLREPCGNGGVRTRPGSP